MIIAFHGDKGAGKDTAAAHLITEHGFRRYAFADDVYREVASAYGVTEEDLRSRDWKNTPQSALRLLCCSNPEFVRLFKEEGMHQPRTSTWLIQRWATEYRRSTNQNYWTEKLARRMYRDDLDKFAITDLREDHEYAMLEAYAYNRSLPLQVVEVRKDGTVHTGHSSDRALNSRYINVVVDAPPGKIDILIESVESIYRRMLDEPSRANNQDA